MFENALSKRCREDVEVSPRCVSGPARGVGWSPWQLSGFVLATALAAVSGVEATEPTVIVDEMVSDWTIGGGFLAWTRDCDHDAGGYLRRRPLLGTEVRTLEQTPLGGGSGFWFWNMAIDESGLYYFKPGTDRLVWRRHATPDREHEGIRLPSDRVPVVGVPMVRQGDQIFWAAESMIVKALGLASFHVADAERPTALASNETHIFWLDGGGLWRCPVSGACQPERMGTRRGGVHLRVTSEHIFWVSRSRAVAQIFRMNLDGTDTERLYVAQDADIRISQPVARGNNLYWKEHRLGTSRSEARVRHLVIGNPAPFDILGDVSATGRKMEIDDSGIYFSGADQKIFFLPLDATRVGRDLHAAELEITQGIQNLDNDVPVSREKTTFVRFYGRLEDGPVAHDVDALLLGTRGGSSLPGSPLRPTNGPLTLRVGEPLLRSDIDRAWLFELPESWTDHSEIDLEAVIDPHEVYNDPDDSNNSLTREVLFKNQPPTCVVFVPVRTGGPQPTTSDPNVWPMIDLARRLMPSPDFTIKSQSSDLAKLDLCWWGIFPYPCFSPYDMTKDGNRVITALIARAALSDSPAHCSNRGTTHYAGMIHPEVVTNPLGKGNFCLPLSWWRFPEHDQQPSPTPPEKPAWSWPRAGSTMAHELSHNFNRYHVDCGGPALTDPNYPYPLCQFDNNPSGNEANDRAIHFGFDINTLSPIAPDRAGDLMSYSINADPKKPRWISDYTWKQVSLGQRTEGPQVVNCTADYIADDAEEATLMLKRLGDRPVLAGARQVMLVGGFVDAQRRTGMLRPAWVLPVEQLSKSQLAFWQQLVAPAYHGADRDFGDLHLRLVTVTGKILTDRLVLPLINAPQQSRDQDGETHFQLTLPAPSAKVARLELLAGDDILATLAPASAVPELQILAPRSAHISNPLRVSWRGRDADKRDALFYTVQYSDDNGGTWRALATDLPGRPDTDELHLDLKDLPGSKKARIRVLASDGYHTAAAISPPFAISNRPPAPHIDSPAGDLAVAAARPIVLRGGAEDPEEGPLAAGSLSWRLDGRKLGVGRTRRLQGLAPGRYEVELLATDSRGEEATAKSSIRIAPLQIPAGNAPRLDGKCEDEAWTGAISVPLASNSLGGRSTVRLLRNRGDLWLCFTRLARTPKTGGFSRLSRAGVRVDPDLSRGDRVQAEDLSFFVREDGVPFSRAGDGRGGFGSQDRTGVEARVSHSGPRWAAELRIEAAARISRTGSLGLVLGHYGTGAGNGEALLWPHRADPLHPDSWAQAQVETAPRITKLVPDRRTAGNRGFQLTVHGQGLGAGTRLLWNNRPLLARTVSPGVLRARITASSVAEAGTARIRVLVPGRPLSEPFTFHITPVRPKIVRLLPAAVPAGAPRPIMLTVRGKGFSKESKVLWNGESRPTRFFSSTVLRTLISTRDLALGRTSRVTVVNPGPGSAISEPAEFVVRKTPRKPDSP